MNFGPIEPPAYMKATAFYIFLLFLGGHFYTGTTGTEDHAKRLSQFPQDTITPYLRLTFAKVELLQTAPGTKSVLFNRDGSRLYAMNLEGMSVYEFKQSSREVTRSFKFKPTKGTGWDYQKKIAVPSYQEKPVEACFSHDDGILWLSLHNAGGIVPVKLNDTLFSKFNTTDTTLKELVIHHNKENRSDTIQVPLIKTGATPKVIARTTDNKHLLVSNWHSQTVSVLEINDSIHPFGKVVGRIAMNAIPRGISID